MNFELSDEQRLLEEAAARVIAQRYGLRNERSEAGAERAASEGWTLFADLGWLALGFDEEYGGISDADVEIMLLAKAFGRGLVREPFYTSVILCAHLIGRMGSADQKQDLLPRLARGELKVALAHGERDQRYGLDVTQSRARPSSEGWRIDGAKFLVLDGPLVDLLLVTAEVGDGKGLGLFLVDPGAGGLRRRDYATTDRRMASDIDLDGVEVEGDAMLGRPGEAIDAIEHAADRLVAVLCADAVGSMEVLVETTAEYLKTRHQFGRPIGSFQALQHRMADMYAALELASSMAIYANLNLSEADAVRQRAVSLAKMQVIESAQLIGRQAIQLHGGIGMTEEYHVGHYFKRLLAFETLFGDASHHATRVEALAHKSVETV